MSGYIQIIWYFMRIEKRRQRQTKANYLRRLSEVREYLGVSPSFQGDYYYSPVLPFGIILFSSIVGILYVLFIYDDQEMGQQHRNRREDDNG